MASVAQGGSTVPYRRLETESTQWIDPARMPRNITILKDMKYWVKGDYEAWASHIEEGQFGRLAEHNIFQFRSITHGYKQPPHPATPLLGLTVNTDLYKLTTVELLYGKNRRRKQVTQQKKLPVIDNWLPPARTLYIYAPFTIEQLQKLNLLHSVHKDFLALLKEIACMEGEGPIHNTTGLADDQTTLNAHVAMSEEETDFTNITPASWLGGASFNSQSDDHQKWSVESLANWVLNQRPHIHKPSGTVYGGPKGVRVPVFATARILQNVERALSASMVPRRLKGHIETADLLSIKLVTLKIVLALRHDVVATRVILAESAMDRRRVFEQQIMSLVKLNRGFTPQTSSEPSSSATSGVPRDQAALRAIADHLRAGQDIENSDADSEYEVAQVTQHNLRMREESMEIIEITKLMGTLNTEDESDSEETPGKFILPPELTNSQLPEAENNHLDGRLDNEQVTRQISTRKSIPNIRYTKAVEALKKKTYWKKK
ncbi:hypothetical protein FRC12_001058 [Ceratobasidium sp. 428]|nr:hypothetical protein FRC12_001058 [Ceratobasidium sp. 428]